MNKFLAFSIALLTTVSAHATPSSNFAASVTNTGSTPLPFFDAFSIPLSPPLDAPVTIDGSLGITVSDAALTGATVTIDPLSPAPGFTGFFGLNGAIQPCADVGGTVLTLPPGVETKTFPVSEASCTIASGGPFNSFQQAVDLVVSPGASVGISDAVTITVPEPSSLVLFGMALLGFAALRSHRAHR